ncbi:hypothetical protein [Listeria ilorinensis]|uniref:hypothetical protein n=1 Tax=Listeria ilorinensis TaxID=2867439 RepID=UPI001EF57D27|nr:hypothetical protein [Listeria ilorinensis]
MMGSVMSACLMVCALVFITMFAAVSFANKRQTKKIEKIVQGQVYEGIEAFLNSILDK